MSEYLKKHNVKNSPKGGQFIRAAGRASARGGLVGASYIAGANVGTRIGAKIILRSAGRALVVGGASVIGLSPVGAAVLSTGSLVGGLVGAAVAISSFKKLGIDVKPNRTTAKPSVPQVSKRKRKAYIPR